MAINVARRNAAKDDHIKRFSLSPQSVCGNLFTRHNLSSERNDDKSAENLSLRRTYYSVVAVVVVP